MRGNWVCEVFSIVYVIWCVLRKYLVVMIVLYSGWGGYGSLGVCLCLGEGNLD